MAVGGIDLIELNKLKADVYKKTSEYLKEGRPSEAYHNKLKRYLKESVLEKIIMDWLKNCKVTPLQGILYINSIVILYDGRIAVYFGDNWNKNGREETNTKQEDWINRTIFALEKNAGTQFKNILTLCNDRREMLKKFPVLVFGKNELSYTHIKIEKYQISADLLEKPAELWRRRKKVFSSSSGLNDTLTNFIEEINKKYSIPINADDAEAFLLNPLRIATKYKVPNLFYIFDSRNIKEPGGIAFAANVDGSLKETHIDEILTKLQDYICDYILTPIVIAESEALREILKEKGGEEPYALRFFCKEIDEEKMETRIPLIYNIEHLNLDNSDAFGNKAIKIREHLKHFFTEATGPSAKAIKDYGIFSEEVFITTLRLWDDLEITYNPIGEIKLSNGNKKRIETINQFRETSKKRDTPLLIDFLFTALNFEPALRHIASYREHFIHCFHTFCFGFWLFCLRKSNNQYLFAHDFPNRMMLLKSWFLAGMFHDIGIPIQKAGDYLQTLVKLLAEKDRLLLFPRWSDLMENSNFHEVLFSDQFNKLGNEGIFAAKDEDPKKALVRINHICVKLLMDKAEHPVLSSMILYDNIKKHPGIYKNSDELFSHVIMPVLVHHIWDEEWKESPTGRKEWIFNNFRRHPLAYLLILCDAISQLERRFEESEVKDEHSKQKEISPIIKLLRLNDPQMANNDCPECSLVYGLSSTDIMNKYIKYYSNPFNAISYGDNPILKVILYCDMDNPIKVNEWTIKSP